MFLNRCIWTPTAGGLADFVVSAAAQNGYVPASCLSPTVKTGAPYHYFAVSGTDHEEGNGTWTTATSTLTRTTIRNSSNGAAKVNFSSPPTVFMGGPVSADLREVLTADRTYYVRTDGSNSNTGLINNAGGAKLTFASAFSDVCSLIDIAGFNVTISMQNTTWNAMCDFNSGWVGSGRIILDGTGATLSVNGSSGNSHCIAMSGTDGGNVTVRNFTLSTTGSGLDCIHQAAASNVTVDQTMTFGSTTSGGVHLQAFAPGFLLVATDTMTISGGSVAHAFSAGPGYLQYYPNANPTLSGSPVFSGAFAHASESSIIESGFTGFTGSTGASSKRYLADTLGLIETFGAGATFWPGDTAGTTAMGGIYD